MLPLSDCSNTLVFVLFNAKVKAQLTENPETTLGYEAAVCGGAAPTKKNVPRIALS